MVALYLSGYFDEVERPLVPTARFDFASMTDADCVDAFRFDKQGIVKLCHILQIPTVVITEARDRILGVDAMCMVWIVVLLRNVGF